MKSYVVPGNAMAVKVLGPKSYDIENALREWKTKMKESDIITRYRDKMEYEKPTSKRRRLKNDAIRNNKRQSND